MIPKTPTPSTNPEKYRPISLLDVLGKIFAKLLNRKLVRHFDNHNIIKDSQHGFRKKRGTTTLMANLYERVSKEKATNRKTLITLITRDVQKAFDKVWHDGIIYKLIQARVDMKLVRILANFLTGRKAYIKINDHIGETFKLTAGVPQGDVLSPTLFTIVGNDYPEPTRNQNQKNF